MARVLSMVIAIVAAVLVFAASVLAVAALLFLRSGDGGPTAVSPAAIPGQADSTTGSTVDVDTVPGPGGTCRPVADRGFDVVASGAGAGDPVTVAVDLVDDAGGHHPQLVAAGAADAEGRATASLPPTVNGREIRSCLVTAVQLGDRVVFADR